jgi:hypothetical protein
MARTAAQFMQRFEHMWSAPSPERFAALFHPGGSFHHPEMSEPLPASAAADYMRGVLQLIPDLSLEVSNWAATGDVVLIEYTQTGTVAGQPLTWKGADRFTLSETHAIEGFAYWDPRPVLDALQAPAGA